ncbi:MAG: M48 family metallopeptidase [Alphaproteobacteria bacterium]|nr:M48 family metallopeptidase [Alphaproteobacteria bacterium]MCB9695230.1 M48 family metallopeptidase [Alphaproteobacteria bacterium]
MADTPYVSLADFAATFESEAEDLPPWVHADASGASILDQLALRHRVEDVLDTVVALQRAEWVQDGVYAGPHTMPEVYRDVLHAARTLRIAVPPAILAGCGLRAQGCFGTDDRAFLYLSTFFFEPASEGERRFLAGHLCGHIAAHHVTASTLYAFLVDSNGIRSLARKGVGPLLEVVLAPLSVGVRLALSRWHRAATISADRAGLLSCRDLEAAGRALLRMHLGTRPDVKVEEYLEQLRTHKASPGRWAELLADQPFTHKRLQAMTLFQRSELWTRLTGESVEDPISAEELDRRTTELLGVS